MRPKVLTFAALSAFCATFEAQAETKRVSTFEQNTLIQMSVDRVFLDHVKNIDARQCQTRCIANLQCVAWTWNPHHPVCVLWDAQHRHVLVRDRLSVGYISGEIKAAGSTRLQAARPDAGQPSDEQKVIENCIILYKPKLVSSQCDFQPGRKLYYTGIRTNPVAGCPRDIEIEYLDPGTAKIVSFFALRGRQNIETCREGVHQVRVKRQ